ncbi:MAG: hypothetical protein FH748_05405 [Balneolaceae bacterium]|nr:hypothetical protein [Balneolaceae bacterium]
MTNKDRKIQLFLQIFFLLAAIYLISDTLTALYSSRFPNDVFEFHNQSIPAFILASGFIAGGLSLISCITLWLRVNWAYAFTLFSSGFIFCYQLTGMGQAIFRNPYETIPMVIILIVLLQSFPFQIRQSTRHM